MKLKAICEGKCTELSFLNPFFYFLCRTGLPLARTRWVWSTFPSHCPLSSNPRCWLTSATLIRFSSKNFLENWNSNSRLLGEKQVCYLCAMQPPFLNPFFKVHDERREEVAGVWFHFARKNFLASINFMAAKPELISSVVWLQVQQRLEGRLLLSQARVSAV